MHAADSLHNNQNEEKDKKDTGGLSYSLGNWFQETEMERARKKNEIEFPWIGADTAFLERCEGDLMDALRVLDGVYVLPLSPVFPSQSHPSPPSPPSHPLLLLSPVKEE